MKRLFADNSRFQFFPGNNRISDLDAEGHVRITYDQKDGSRKGAVVEQFHTASEKMKAAFELMAGESALKSMSQWGTFSYEDGTRSASSGRCDYDAASGILVLKESIPKMSDETKWTTGQQIEFDRNSKLVSVHGRVQSTFSAQKGSPSFFGTSASSSAGNVKADEMRYWTDTGIVRYTGSVHLLSENQDLQTDWLEISNGLDHVDAQGSILHLLSMKDASQSSQSAKSREVYAADTLTTVQSSAMTYSKEKNTITYSGKVTLHSKDVDLSSDKLDAVPDSEGKKIERSTARGNVTLHVGVREFKGEAADYYSSPEKFVMTGKPATVSDPGSGRSASPRLTYTTADDRILLEK
jgi:lipopolysaccharide export system protein LptA